MTFLILVFTTACQYYQVKVLNKGQLPQLVADEKAENVFFLHKGGVVYHFEISEVAEDAVHGKLTFNRQPVYENLGIKKGRVTKHNREILHEVHVFCAHDASFEKLPDGLHKIPVREIDKLEVVNSNTGATVLTILGSIVGGAALVLAVLLLLYYGDVAFISEVENFEEIAGRLDGRDQACNYAPQTSEFRLSLSGMGGTMPNTLYDNSLALRAISEWARM